MSGPIRSDKVEPERVEWLWRDRIPRGMITIVAGRPDQGKGLFAAHVAAEVSAAGGTVLYSASEDSHGLMTRPRLEAAGADLERILLWRFAIPMNFRELSELVTGSAFGKQQEPGQPIDLVVMDPFASHLSGGISRHSDNVRQALQPIAELIESTNTAVLIIEHALKRGPQNGHPLQFIGGGGSGLPAFSRAAYVFGKDPDDEDRRVLAPAKFNVGPWPKALAFEIDVEEIDVVGDVPMLVVDDELLTFDPMRLFQTKAQPGKVGRPPDKRAAAAEWLTNYLASAAGPVHSGKVQEDAKQYGMATKTLRRAAEDMGVVKNPPGGGRNCTWDLPDDVKDLMGLPVQRAADGDPDDDGLVDPGNEQAYAGAGGDIVSVDAPHGVREDGSVIQPDEANDVDAMISGLLGGEEEGDGS